MASDALWGYLFVMNTAVMDKWLDAWGYKAAPSALHRPGRAIAEDHAYRAELSELLRPDGGVRAEAVFDVDGVPTVCFLADDGRLLANPGKLAELRRRIWNQNLVSVVLLVGDDEARAMPVARLDEAEVIALEQARPFSAFSAQDVQSGDLFTRHADWFKDQSRVDQRLLDNLSELVRALETHDGLSRSDAQFLTAQVLFVAYLEDRGIIGDRYCEKHQVNKMRALLRGADKRGIIKLLRKLKGHLNGDLLESETSIEALWNPLQDRALERLNGLLRHDDLVSGQLDMWGYDFRYLPVELISGVYERFLGESQKKDGAFYTPPYLANFVVDQVVSQSPDFLEERVCDMASGSGILLTTAFRRMLSIAEARAGRQYSLRERVELLQGHIFGADISETACRVTAFSLYLSLLEGLEPSDLAHLTEDGKEAVKLPHLRNHNLQWGKRHGDFFSNQQGHLKKPGFTVLLCNPPWVEPDGKVEQSSDVWAKKEGLKLPRRNTAAAFMHRAAQFMTEDAILCWILPASLFAAPTSQGFMRTWLERFAVERLINFGDLRKLLFQGAKQPTIVAMARRRAEGAPIHEDFEYWVPKADLSFAFNRLTLHGGDRHNVPSRLVAVDNEILTTLYWGSYQDSALIARLRGFGTIGQLCGPRGRWTLRKGFHRIDTNAAELTDSTPLRNKKFLNANVFSADSPVLNENDLKAFPAEYTRLPGLDEDLLKVFKGPRILYSDGLTTTRRIRAVFSTRPFSFMSSLSVLSGPNADEDVLRFLAVYLRSDLACYFVAMTAYQAVFERDSIRNVNVKRFPFALPEAHPDPKLARTIVAKVAAFTRQLEDMEPLLRPHAEAEWMRTDGHELLANYFGLSDTDRSRMQEVATVVLPFIQPGAQSQLTTGPLRQRPDARSVEHYLTAMRQELDAWRDAGGGAGKFKVTAVITHRDNRGALGLVNVQLAGSGDRTQSRSIHADTDLLTDFLQSLDREQVLPTRRSAEDPYVLTDAVIGLRDSVYLVKPLIRRFWMRGTAFDDAARVVDFIRTRVGG